MRLWMLSGLPGSGKSTKARALVKDSGGSGRVNRDDLRTMLFNSVWSGKREAVVVDCEKAIADVLFKHKMSVVVDDTNLPAKNKTMWSQFTRERGQQFESLRMNTTLEECLQRDALRENPVGQAIINRFALQAGMIEWGDKSLILCDIDGTIASCEARLRFVEAPGKKDWRGFYSEIANDDPIDFVIRWVRELAKEHTICLVSGRPDTYQFETINWLKRHQVPYNYIFMRRGSDSQSDVIVKNEILSYLPKEKILFCLDDRPVVLREVWGANGIKAYPVRGACKEF